ncbi:MAG TPA: hypothetical protein VGL00_01205 [Terracidiphilus sp.]
MLSKSPKKAADHVLGMLSVQEIQSLLMDSLNLPNPIDYPEHRPQFERWLKRWQRLFTFRGESEDGERRTMQVPRDQLERFAPKARTTLRRIWNEKDARQRDWYFYRLRDDYNRLLLRLEHPYLFDVTDTNAVARLAEFDRESEARGDDLTQRIAYFDSFVAGADLFNDVPRICPFEAAVYWLQMNQKLMVYCAGPMCAAPFFFRSEKGQRYCSPECADPARKDAKLKWWNENRKKKSAH